ncbi:uncharacterized protein JCM15063_006130 [Sporobolomyces koalae]|uniref:uncharacterized protein n=1 Tax=Sporobolomyces koalae TaxID=500713 RepID=UPI00316E2AD3
MCERSWLQRVVQQSLKRIQSANTAQSDERWDELLEQAATILSRLDDDQRETIYILPTTTSTSVHARTTTPQTVKIRNHTLLSSQTGHRTWGSAPALSRRMCLNPQQFFPHSALPSSQLRVLELGSGTGLVGIAALAILDSLERNALVTLSDGGDSLDAVSTDGVIGNLRHNLDTYLGGRDPDRKGIDAEIKQFRWDDYLALPTNGEDPNSHRPKRIRTEQPYDVILATDCVYEPQHAESLHAAVSAHLRFPSSSTSLSSPAFHLILPLRRTHASESAAVDRMFPPALSERLPGQLPPQSARAAERTWRLVATEREHFRAPDGFADNHGRDHRIIEYRRYKIEWEEIA